MSNLSSVIKSIQDVMRQDSGVDGDAQRISQLTWLLFLKVFDALEEELELTRDSYTSPIPEPLRWRNWAADAEGITGDTLLSFVNNDLFGALKTLSGDAQRNPRGFVVRGVFEDAYNYMKSGHLLRQVINKLGATSSTTSTKKSSKTCKAPATRASSTPPAPSPSSWWTWSTRNSAKRCWTPPPAPAAFWSAP